MTITLNKEVKLFSNPVNFAVSIKFNRAFPRDQPQFRARGKHILFDRRIQLAFAGEDLSTAFHGLNLICFHAVQLIFLHIMTALAADAVTAELARAVRPAGAGPVLCA